MRHSEQRILIRDDDALTECFVRDFVTIWERLGGARAIDEANAKAELGLAP